MKFGGAIFWENKNFTFFLMWTTLNFEGRSKMKKKRARDICKGTLDIEFERDWWVGLGATLGVVKTFFEKIEIFIYFLYELPLILGLGGILRKTRYICKWTFYIEFEQDRPISLGSTLGDTDTHIAIFPKTLFFWMWTWYRIEIHKKSKSNFLTIAILPSMIMSLQGKKYLEI